jgi:hypothetical protein
MEFKQWMEARLDDFRGTMASAPRPVKLPNPPGPTPARRKTNMFAPTGPWAAPPTDMDDPPPDEKDGRRIKDTWRRHADHKFMDSVIKVHWLQYPEDLLWMLDPSSRRHEIATQGYKPDSKKLYSAWGNVGVEVKGRTTLAANHMNSLRTGRVSSQMSSKIAWRHSGVPRRPKTQGEEAFKRYIVDDESMEARDAFDDAIRDRLNNEFVVDNWRPVRIIVNSTYVNSKILDIAKNSGLPVVNGRGDPA